MEFTRSADHEAIREGIRRVCTDFPDEYWAAQDEAHEFPWAFYDALAAGGWVGIGLSTSTAGVTVRVEDRGPGVLSDELERLFVPFYRGAQASGRNGHGLGLAIARQIVGQHRGRIEAANRPEGGLCLTVVLPMVAASGN